jgi:hypothetical protein
MRDRLEGSRNTISESRVISTSSSPARVRSTRHCGSVMSWARSVGRTLPITASRARIRQAGNDCRSDVSAGSPDLTLAGARSSMGTIPTTSQHEPLSC